MCPSGRPRNCWSLTKRKIRFIWWARSWMNWSLMSIRWSNTSAIWSVRWGRIHSVWIHINLTIWRWLISRWSTWSLARGHWIGWNRTWIARWDSRGTWWMLWQASSDITGIEGWVHRDCLWWVFQCNCTYYFRTFYLVAWNSFDHRWWRREGILVIAQNYYYIESSSNVILICVENVVLSLKKIQFE